ncbi:MAG TPA: PIN domain-containing protein [Terriglobales bacterium]|nr:PIN domain-containing protein [Terriglobales bacterium]
MEERFVVLPMTARISALSQELPPEFPNDPGDRLIGATAWAEDAVLVTADRAIRRCAALRTVW